MVILRKVFRPFRYLQLAGPVAVMAWATALAVANEHASTVQPLIERYCHDCHADGVSKGNIDFDVFKSDEARLADHKFWEKVLKNLRAELMPPSKKPQPTAVERAQIEQWIKRSVFKLDPLNPDPGRVTLRRLNRVEYQNTISDLMGVEFRAFEEFPPDDTGYGFDNIGDVLTTSPLLLEKYMAAAETIVARAVPTVSRKVAEQRATGSDFKSRDGQRDARNLSFYKPATLTRTFQTAKAGEYRLMMDAEIDGGFDFDPGRARISITLNDTPLLVEEHKWQNDFNVAREYVRDLPAGEHVVTITLEPLVPEDKKRTSVDFRLRSMLLQGPLDREQWVHPPNYQRFFTRDEPPATGAERAAYARETLRRFASQAYRRPVDEATVDKLVAIAESEYRQPGKSFEAGVGRAMVAVLASPRFLFRTETTVPPEAPGRHPLVDEYALASRLSYFLWSTMPDAELLGLAARGELRKNLGAQVKRLMSDRRSDQFVENFVGQWLLTRDIEGISINERSVLARDSGQDREQEKARARFASLRDIPPEKLTAEEKKEIEAFRASFRRGRGPTVELNSELRVAMRRESELVFDHIVREDRSILELIQSDYTFLNERLAKHYGIPEVKGNEMRKVTLAPDSPRGGVLTQGSVLVVTSNPTRTSPVKRGVFLLDHILGTPAPPPPAAVPALEDAEKVFTDREPSLRETLQQHRSNALCKSCHDRMDPLGLALENFNALGMWRETERKQPILPGGELVTGEKFSNIRELKGVLATNRRLDFYRCLTEKLLTYALGRGLDHHDIQAMDEIVARLQREEGRFSALLTGVIESAPFQRRRAASEFTNNASPDRAQLINQNTAQP